MNPNLRSSLSRRSFVGRLAVGAAALALASRSHGQTPPSKKLGIALCGLGQYARGQLAPAHSYQGIKAVTSKGPLTVREIASQQALQMEDFALCVREQRGQKRVRLCFLL